MILIGLTGSIGMGKSTIARMFADEGIPVWDADVAVHRLYAEDEALKQNIQAQFGEVITNGHIDRAKLNAALALKPENFARLNAIVHPRVGADRQAFITYHKSLGTDMIVCDIPLLFESGLESQFDKRLVITAPLEVQKQRVMARPGMTQIRFETLLARQMSDAEKLRRADMIIDTSLSLEACKQEVRLLIKNLRAEALQKRPT
jgi:dephospho-CoA kinase